MGTTSLLALFLVAASGPALPRAGPPHAATRSGDALADVRAVLRRTGDATPARDDVLVRRLVALGAQAAPALLACATGEALDALLDEDAPEAWMCPPDRVGELALAALAELPQVPLEASLRAAALERPTREVRASALIVLGRAGSADGLDLWFELLVAAGDEIAQRSIRAPAQDALLAILEADQRAARTLEPALATAPLGVQLLVCEALARARRGDAAVLLGRAFGRAPELDRVALASLAELAARHPWRMPAGAAAVEPRVRAFLDGKDPALRALAARSLGALHDAASVPALIARLDDPAPEVARAALWALRETCSDARRESRAEWQAWLDGEREFWTGPGRTHLAALERGEPAVIAPALRALLPHPLGRDAVAAALVTRLPDLDPAARASACGTLALLGSRLVVPDLVELLFEPDAAVRHAAWQALRALTGEELPPEPRLWERYASG